MSKKPSTPFSAEIQRQLDDIRENWEGWNVNENNGTIHVANATITKIQLNGSAGKNWIMVKSKTYWLKVEETHFWLVKDCYMKRKSIDVWATPFTKNHGKMIKIQTSGN